MATDLLCIPGSSTCHVQPEVELGDDSPESSLPELGGHGQPASAEDMDMADEASELSDASAMQVDVGVSIGGCSVTGEGRRWAAKRMRSSIFARAPHTVDDAMKWPTTHRVSLHQEGMLKNMIDKLNQGVVIDSDFSGSGCMEQAVHMRSMDLRGLIHGPLFTAHRCSDIDPMCQLLLRNISQGQGKRHVFGDLLSRLLPQDLDKLLEASSRWQKTMDELVDCCGSNKGDESKMRRMVGRGMCREMVACLRSATLETTSFCSTHDKKCSLFRKGPWNVWSGGNSCLNWSQMGKQEQWVGRDALAFFVWMECVRREQPDIVIQECTPRFDLVMIREALGQEFDIQARHVCPSMLGLGVQRPRLWSIITYKPAVQWVERFDGPAFSKIFHRTGSTLIGQDYFVASQEERTKALEFMACLHTSPGSRKRAKSSCKARSAETVASALPVGGQCRLAGYVKLIQESWKFAHCNSVVINVDQNPAKRAIMNQNMPTLLTDSNMVMLQRSPRSRPSGPSRIQATLMVPDEHLYAMGWPMFPDKANNIMRDVVDFLPGAVKKKFAGNDMHIAVAGAILDTALSFTIPTKTKASHFNLME